MTAFYDEFRTLAIDLITDFGSGGTGTFTRTARTLDPLTGTETITEATHTALVAVPPDTDRSREMGRVQGWDTTFECALFADGFIPATGDLVTLPGRSPLVIVSVGTKQPDGDHVAFTIMAKRGG